MVVPCVYWGRGRGRHHTSKGRAYKKTLPNDCIGILVGQYQMRRRVIYFCRHDEAGVIRQSARRNWIEIFRRGQICRCDTNIPSGRMMMHHRFVLPFSTEGR